MQIDKKRNIKLFILVKMFVVLLCRYHVLILLNKRWFPKIGVLRNRKNYLN